MRERTKTILWIVVATFIISIFALWGMDLRAPQRRLGGGRDIAGTVDKHPISQTAYSDMVNQLYTQLRTEKGENYTPSEMEKKLLDDQAWELSVQNRLLSEQIKRLNITVSDAELISFLRQNPHPSLQNVFKTQDGKFDYQAYLKALSNPQMDWTQLEQWGRGEIPILKLTTYVLSQVTIPEREILDRYQAENGVMKAEYVVVPIAKENSSYTPTDAEIQARYEKDKSDLTDPPMRRLRVLALERKPTAADEEDVRNRLSEIRRDIVAGTTDFAKAAQEYSDDNATSDKGGELGFFKKGELPAEIDKVAFSMKVGEISEPFRTQTGYDIVQVEGRKSEGGVEKARARHIAMKVEPGSDTIDSLNTVIKDISTDIASRGLEKVAEERKLKTFDTEPFAQGMFIKELGFVPQVVSFAFNYKTGNVSYGIESESKIYFVKVLQEIPERVKPLAEVRSRLIDEMRADRDADAARKTADALRAEIISTGRMDAPARARGLVAKETPSFKEGDAIAGIGANSTFSVACKFLATGMVSPPIKDTNCYYIIKMKERTEPDMAKYAEARKGIVAEMRNELSQRFMANWYQGIRERANVVDLREKPLK